MVFLILVSIPLNCIMAYSGPPTIYEYQDNQNSNVAYLGGPTYYVNRFGENFTVGYVGANEAFYCTNISVSVSITGQPNPLQVKLFNVDANHKPTGTYIGIGNKTYSTMTGGTWIMINLTVIPILQPNTEYVFYLNSSQKSGSHQYNVYKYTSNQYNKGKTIYSTDSGATWAFYEQDLKFRINGYRSNSAPTQSSPSPSNGATGVLFYPKLMITLNDAEGNSMTAHFRSNYSGPWSTLQTNSSVGNGTYRYQSTFHTFTKKVWWSVNLTDGTSYTNNTYSFTLKISTAPINSLSQPAIGAIMISQPYSIITISDIDADYMNNTIRTNNTGTWINLCFTNHTLNTTITCYIPETFFNHTYWWSSNTTDNHSKWSNNTYNFYLIKTASRNISFVNNHHNDTWSHTYTYSFNLGYTVYDNDTGNITSIYWVNSHHNTTWSHSWVLKSNNTWEVTDTDNGNITTITWINSHDNTTWSHVKTLLGNDSWQITDYDKGNLTALHIINTSSNVTGYILQVQNSTGYYVTVHLLGTGGGNGTGGTYNVTINLVSLDGLNFSVNWSGDYNSTNRNITVPVNRSMHLLASIGVLTMNIIIDMAQFGLVFILLLTAFLLFMGYSLNNKRGGWFIFFGGLLSFTLIALVLATFGGISIFISPILFALCIRITYDGILTILYSGKTKK